MEKIPVDATLTRGTSSKDESTVIGESVPVSKKVGDAVIGGIVNSEGMLTIKATKVGSDSFLSQAIKLLEDAMGKKPAMQNKIMIIDPRLGRGCSLLA